MEDSSGTPVRIRLLREMAAGPMSAVFVGEQPSRYGPRRVAIKLLRQLPDGGVDRLLDLRDRARRLTELEHRHHAPALDVARVDERFALISSYVDGIDLLDWMDVLAETGKMLPRRVACEILGGIAAALDAALHWNLPSTGQPCSMVHRDLKPSNVIIARDGSLRITDFGTGFTALAGRTARAGALKKGLVRYLAPERREGHRATEASDAYALGVLAIELFRGRWLKRLRNRNPAHDRQLADVIARLEDLQLRSDSDDRAMRNLLLRMVAFDEEARPEITEVVSTFRTLGDRIEGPSLEAFATAHAVPWLEPPPREAEERLVNAEAVIVERGRPLPPAGGGLSVVTLPDRYDLQLDDSAGDTGEYPYDEVTDPRLRRGSDRTAPPREQDPTEPLPRLTTQDIVLQLEAERAERDRAAAAEPIDDSPPPVRTATAREPATPPSTPPAGLLDSTPRAATPRPSEARLTSLPEPGAPKVREVFVDPSLAESPPRVDVEVTEDLSEEPETPTEDALPLADASTEEGPLPFDVSARTVRTTQDEVGAAEQGWLLPALVLGAVLLLIVLITLTLLGVVIYLTSMT
ncbi:MAG: hypothetical protein EA397_11165 [Deltaproteobacteria bacterium]|nr:MAG: hypothetical protein EA397_11165 [Deltaproteobacteria bacterium]